MKSELRDKALQAWAYKKSELEKRQREREAKESQESQTQFLATFGLLPERVEGRRVEIEGLTLLRRAWRAGHDRWVILERCERCNKEYLASWAEIDGLADLGRYLDNDSPRKPSCSCEKPEPPESELVRILKKVLAR